MAAVEFVGLEPVDDEWMREAACKGLTHLFFPSSAERPGYDALTHGTKFRKVCGDARRTWKSEGGFHED